MIKRCKEEIEKEIDSYIAGVFWLIKLNFLLYYFKIKINSNIIIYFNKGRL